MACVRKWRGVWVTDYRDETGRRRIEKAASRDEAHDRLAEIRRAMRNGTYDPARAEALLRDFAVQWLKMRQAELKPSTLASYEYALRVHVLPELGNIPLGRLTRSSVRLFLSKKNTADL